MSFTPLPLPDRWVSMSYYTGALTVMWNGRPRDAEIRYYPTRKYTDRQDPLYFMFNQGYQYIVQRHWRGRAYYARWDKEKMSADGVYFYPDGPNQCIPEEYLSPWFEDLQPLYAWIRVAEAAGVIDKVPQ